jgi:hypothetical protein
MQHHAHDGRSPGLRVIARKSAFPVAQWRFDFALSADSCGGSRGIGASPAPRSLLTSALETRRTINACDLAGLVLGVNPMNEKRTIR